MSVTKLLVSALALGASAVAALAQGPADLGLFTVDKVELKRDFHGRLGNHLCETLTLLQGTRRFVLELRCEREKFMRGRRSVPGDTVRVRGTVSGDKVSAERKDVVAARQA